MATDQEKFDKIKKILNWVELNIDDLEDRFENCSQNSPYGCDIVELIQAVLQDRKVEFERRNSLHRLIEEDSLPEDECLRSLIKPV